MKNTNTKNGAPKNNAAILRTNHESKPAGLLSKAKAMLAFAVLLSLQLMTGNANAQIATYTGSGGTSTTVTYYAGETGTALTATGLGSNTPCSSGGLSGLTNNGVTTFSTANGHVYFTVTPNSCNQLNVTSFTAKLRRSGSGIAKVRMAYSTDGGTTWVNDLTDKAPDNTSCGGGTTTFSWNTNGGATPLPTSVTGTLIIALYPYAPISSGGVIQFNSIVIGGTISSAGACGAVASGTVTPTSTSVCGGATSNVGLSLSGATTGCGMQYQWQQSPDGSTWSNITGATNTNFTTPTSTPSTSTATYYEVISTCTVSSVTATSSTAVVTVNPVPSAGAIVATSTLLTLGATETLTNATAPTGADYVGVWSTANTTIGTIDASAGVYGATGVGTNVVTYTENQLSTGCSNTAAPLVINTTYPGDLALYEGTGGSSTSVIGIANETVTALTPVGGFGSNTPCTTGGLSGLTVNTTVATYSSAGPAVVYTITPVTGYALNINKFYVSSRSSSTGPTEARLAYRVNGGSWMDEGFDHILSTTGSCGARTNTWSWTPTAAINGVTTNFEIGVFPYLPGSSTGTFQVQELEVLGVITPSVSCTGTPLAGVVTPSLTVACLNGYAALTLAGDAGVGISYQWDSSTDGTTYYPVASGTGNNIYYTSPTQIYSVTPVTYYEVVTTCATSTGTSISSVSTLTVTPLPDAITVSSGSITPLIVTTSATLADATPGGVWSNYTNAAVASIGSSTGVVTGLIPGSAIEIDYTTPGYHCYAATTMNVIDANTIAVYWGTGGTSTAVTPLEPVTTSSLTATGFGSNTPCSHGGLSGITVSSVVTTWAPTNPNVSFSIIPVTGNALNVTGINATVRSSTSGPQSVQLAYSLDGGAHWTNNGSDLGTNLDGCGISNTELSWPVTFTTTTNVLVGVFPYNSISSTGTFQVNTLSATGSVCNVDSIVAPTLNLNGEIYNDGCGTFPVYPSPSDHGSGFSWSSSNPSVASIDGSGNITLHAVTTDQTVTITYVSSCGGFYNATFTVSHSHPASCDGMRMAAPASGTTASAAVSGVTFFPNPAENTLNIMADQKVNVSILSMDGKMLISQNDAHGINVSALPGGLYLIKVYDANNSLIKTGKFTKE